MRVSLPAASVVYASAVVWTGIAAGRVQDSGSTSGIHLPLQRQTGRTAWKRSGNAAAMVGVGDNMDVTYNVLVQVGGTRTPLIIDTGSSDLWLVSSECRDRCPSSGVPLYTAASITSTGQSINLLYGDSRTGTHASGVIGKDTISMAGLSVPDQYFAAIMDTNTTVLQTGSAGILGLGFPSVSLIWRQLLDMHPDQSIMPPSKRSVVSNSSTHASPPSAYSGTEDLTTSHKSRQETLQLSPVDTFSTLGPLLTRLVTLKVLERPLVVTTLQRDTISFSSNEGTLSLGALPFGLSDNQLTWAPVRSYSVAQGGLPPPPYASNEIYPLAWEVPMDEVYFDGVKLPRSTLSPPSISLSALVDTGNSLMRGPQDVLAAIYTHLGLDASGTFDCSTPHNLSFQIGGKQFPVDPRDFAHPAAVTPGTVYSDEIARCTPALAPTDPPGNGGFQYSWSLGDPFLKSTMVAFYYGNMTHPSQDPARIGFMSMVPSDAGSVLEQAVDAAIANGGVFLSTSEPAPYATPVRLVSTMTMADVPDITQGSPRTSSSAGRGLRPSALWWIYALMAALSAGVLAFFP
ncbi:acid protease [Trametes coccinea BRFM310]|uniref:Acid protease n=1 Tax=Trametes coccinea (strain BRFM310) TaxID=1353009 RepID=A0A1Y2ICN5_TRAC3|nr:acid protease [Trametes coccinea BRFM310]